MKEFSIVRGLLDNRERKLTLTHDFLEFENSDQNKNLFTRLKKEDIASIRYGINFINGYRFYMGRDYQIFISKKNGKELKINFKVYFGRKLNERHMQYSEIVNALWEYYFIDIVNDYLKKYQENIPMKISNVEIFKDQIRFGKTEIFFGDLKIQQYHHYFVMYSETNKDKNLLLYHLKDKDSIILRQVLKHLLNG